MENNFRYNYRYFLPYAPEWGDKEHCRRRLDELLDFCGKAKVEAVSFFVNLGTGEHYMPPVSADAQRHWADWMGGEVAPALREAGLSYQLNFMLLLGANTGGADFRGKYPWRFMVDQHGDESRGCPCPADPLFREIMGKMLRLWASTQPDIFWIDDDFRLHNHGNRQKGLDFYCYCHEHLEKFSALVGRRISREELVGALLAPGEPNPLRGQWLDFCSAEMVDLADWIHREVTAAAPETRIALMIGRPECHSMEGRDWAKTLKALSPDHTPCIRPPCCCYYGNVLPPAVQTHTYTVMQQSVDVLRQSLGDGNFESMPEIENTRFTTWSKSAANTRYQMFLSALCGGTEATLSLNDLEGNPIAEEPSNLPLLQEMKPRLNALARLGLASWRHQGLCFPNSPDMTRNTRLPAGASSLEQLCPSRLSGNYWLSMGLPGYVAMSDAAASDIVCMDGYCAASLPDETIVKILSGPVILDGAAASELSRRGFGRHLGLEAEMHEGPEMIAYEQYAEDFASTRFQHQCDHWAEIKANGAEVLSDVVAWSGRRHSGMTLFGNSLGGVVAAIAQDCQFNGWPHSHGRLRRIHALISRMNPAFPLLPVVPQPALGISMQQGRRHLFALANLGYDPLSKLPFRNAPQNGDGVEYLDKSGEWKKCGIFNDSRLPETLNVFDFLIIRWSEN